MGAPEALFCSIVQAQYAATTAAIQIAIGIPSLALKLLKSNLQRVKLVVYAALGAAVDVLVAQLDAIFKLVDVKNSDNGMGFCQVAFSCKALMNALFDEDSRLLPFLSDEDKQNAKENYKLFEKFVCKNGLEALVLAFIDEQVDKIEEKIDELEEKLLGAIGLDDLIAAYMQKLQEPIFDGKNIFELLALLDDFAECAFSVCNVVATSQNKGEEFQEKLQIEKNGNAFSFVMGELEESILEEDAKMRKKMQEMRDKIKRWRDQKVTEAGTKPDEVMG